MTVPQTYAQGDDLSKHDVVTPDGVIHQYGNLKPLDFTVLRSSIGYLRDVAFPSLLQDTASIPIRGAYHYDFVSYDWKREVDNFLGATAGTGMHFLAWDYEKIGNTLTTATDARCKVILDFLRETTKLPIFLYSNLSTFAEMYNRGSKWILNERLWVARWFEKSYYLQTATGPYHSLKPSWATAEFWNAARWDIWQYGADKAPFDIMGKGQGAEYGTQGFSIDLNAYNGSVAKMRAELNIGEAPQLPPPPEPTDAEKLSILWDEYLRTHQ